MSTPANKAVRRGDPRIITDRTQAGLTPCTAVFLGATSVTQATAVTGGRLAYLAPRINGYSVNFDNTTNPMAVAYTSGDTAEVVVLESDLGLLWAMAAASYTSGQELTVGASGRLKAATTGDTVVAHYAGAAATLSAGDLADVDICIFYTK